MNFFNTVANAMYLAIFLGFLRKFLVKVLPCRNSEQFRVEVLRFGVPTPNGWKFPEEEVAMALSKEGPGATYTVYADKVFDNETGDFQTGDPIGTCRLEMSGGCLYANCDITYPRYASFMRKHRNMVDWRLSLLCYGHVDMRRIVSKLNIRGLSFEYV